MLELPGLRVTWPYTCSCESRGTVGYSWALDGREGGTFGAQLVGGGDIATAASS